LVDARNAFDLREQLFDVLVLAKAAIELANDLLAK